MIKNIRSFTLKDVLYCSSSLIFFYIQLHIVVRYVIGMGSLLDVVFSLTAFKLGELSNEKIDFGPFFLWLILATLSSGLVLQPSGPVLFFGCFLFGFSMKKVRERFFPYVDRNKKIWFRTFAFILAPFTQNIVYFFVICIFLLSGIGLLMLKDTIAWQHHNWTYKRIRMKKNIWVYWSMFLHHLHYFAYAYSIPLVLSMTKVFPPVTFGIIFFLGWAVYNPYEHLVKPSWKWFNIGHILSVILLTALFFEHNPVIVVILWFLTGLGGGTVYMLSHLLPDITSESKQELQIAEGYGHVVGILCWGIFVTRSVFETFFVSTIILVILLISSFFITSNTRIIVSPSKI